MNSWHVGVAAEAMVAAQFARYGYDVSVQYGADQPEYDLIASRGDEILKVSVKGSKDGAWGLTQSLKKGRTYHEAIDEWLNKHHKKTIFCLVQFENITDNELPKMYLATPNEIAEVMRRERKGLGDTILYMNHTWGPTAQANGTTDKIPEEWLFTRDRADEIFAKYAR